MAFIRTDHFYIMSIGISYDFHIFCDILSYVFHIAWTFGFVA
jgi:hypothetical protein